MCVTPLELSNYIIGDRLGDGSSGVVCVAKHRDQGRRYAAKMVVPEMHARERLRTEIANHGRLHHPNIVALHEVVGQPNGSTVLIMDLVPGKELFDYVNGQDGLQEAEAQRLFRQLVDAVGHCHARRVVHRDLKLENVMVDEGGNVQLIDFGVSVDVGDGLPLTDAWGSLPYSAPELLQQKPRYIGEPVDVWALGVILYAMLSCEMPFDDDCHDSLVRAICKGRYDGSAIAGISTVGRDIIARMLTVDPAERITIDELRKHPWLQPLTKDQAFTFEAIEPTKMLTSANAAGSKSSHDSAGRRRSRSPRRFSQNLLNVPPSASGALAWLSVWVCQ